MRIGVDSGGTFTDFVWTQAGADGKPQRFEMKLPSTPKNPAEAVLEGVDRIMGRGRSSHRGGNQADNIDVVHATTVGTNALLTRTGGRVLLVTTSGFEDVLDIGRQNRPELYALHPTVPLPLVPKEFRVGVEERLAPDGSTIAPLSERTVQDCLRMVSRLRPDAVAVCLLHSYANCAHEMAVRKALLRSFPSLTVFLSSTIDPYPREYERWSTTVIHAYLSTVLGTYIKEIEGRLPANCELQLVNSAGARCSTEAVQQRPADFVLSGPAAGAIGASLLARKHGVKSFVGLDMGGTSTDVCFGCKPIEPSSGWVLEDGGSDVAGMPLRGARLAVHTIGAGGGSIARLGMGGALLVGPESAGADPGPAAYGKGDLVTVTDADLMLGRLSRKALLGGDLHLDHARSRRYLTYLAESAGLTVSSCAKGIAALAGYAMTGAVAEITQRRAIDPSGATLIPFGGAGGMHACDVAQQLGMDTVLFPVGAGCLSALGALLAPVRAVCGATVMKDLAAWRNNDGCAQLEAIEHQATSKVRRAHWNTSRRMSIRHTLSCRYEGQSHELELELNSTREGLRSIMRRFNALHEESHGYSDSSHPIEVVGLSVCAAREAVEPPGIWNVSREDMLNSPSSRLSDRLAGPVSLTGKNSTAFLGKGWHGSFQSDGSLLARRT